MTRFRTWVLAVTATVVLAAAGSLRAEEVGPTNGLVVRDAWIPEAPSVVPMHAGYLALKNLGPRDRRLVHAASPAYARVEIHVSRVADGVATMQPLAQVTVPAGETVRFAPGGLHLMLMRPQRDLKVGDRVALTLRFDDGTEIAATATVRPAGHRHEGHGHGHDHGS